MPPSISEWSWKNIQRASFLCVNALSMMRTRWQSVLSSLWFMTGVQCLVFLTLLKTLIDDGVMRTYHTQQTKTNRNQTTIAYAAFTNCLSLMPPHLLLVLAKISVADCSLLHDIVKSIGRSLLGGYTLPSRLRHSLALSTRLFSSTNIILCLMHPYTSQS